MEPDDVVETLCCRNVTRSGRIPIAAQAVMGALVLLFTVTGCATTPSTPGAATIADTATRSAAPPPTAGTTPVPAETEPSSTCSPSGARISLGPVDGATGLRVVQMILTNCGHTSYRVNNYPMLAALDEQHRPARITVRHASYDSIAPHTPQRLVLQPGQTAVAELSWRNTVIDPHDIATASYLAVIARPGETRFILPLAIDAGTTHRLAVTGWRAPRTTG